MFIQNSIGYNGPISILIGIYENGFISGIKVLHHTENIEQAKQIETKAFQNQFKNKKISDPFKPKFDVDNITGATVTTTKLAEIIKNSASLVYKKYLLHNSNEIKPKKNNLFFLPYLSIFILALVFIILNAYLSSKYKRIKKYNPFILLIIIYIFEAIILFSVFDTLKRYVSNSNNPQQLYKEKSSLNLNSQVYNDQQASPETNSLSNSTSNTDQSENEEPIILNPKWGIQKINNEKINQQIKNNNLSDKEALNYKETK